MMISFDDRSMMAFRIVVQQVELSTSEPHQSVVANLFASFLDVTMTITKMMRRLRWNQGRRLNNRMIHVENL